MSAESEATPKQENWSLIIRPQRAWWDLRLGDLWRYRDLVVLFVWRDFVSTYKQTILGPLWHMVQPIATTLVFTVIFGNIAQLSTDGLPPFLFYMSGNTVWSYFSACLTSTSDTFRANAGIFGKVYFPRLITPVSIVISNLISFGIQFLIFLGFMIYFKMSGSEVYPNFWVLLLPILLMIMAGMGLGLGIIISSLTTKYRDLQKLVGFGVQLFMYGTPVIYPLSSVDVEWRWLILANPMTPIVEFFRMAFLGTSSLSPIYLLYSFGVVVIIVLAGVLVFNRVEATFMDTV
ncbi:MAG: ABC transporter permease [Anaerolineales bacterium]|nr:ABC transporter permease [Anaerolineales bacterium]